MTNLTSEDAGTASYKKEVTIVTSGDAGTIEVYAAKELIKYLSEIYPDYKFPVSLKSDSSKTIYLNVTGNSPGVPDNDEGYLIESDSDNAYIKKNNPEVINSFITAKLVRGYQQVLIDLGR